MNADWAIGGAAALRPLGVCGQSADSGPDSMQAKILAAVQRVDGVMISPAVAKVLVHWLGRYAELAVQRYGAVPDGLALVQSVLAEAVAGGGDSRQRDSEPIGAPGLLALAEEPVMSLEAAAVKMGLKPDTARLKCRNGTLSAKKVGRSWFPTVAAVQEELHRRSERGA